MPPALTYTWRPFDALTRAELYEVLQLRQAVFVVEQDCPYLDADGLDDRALHLLGRPADGADQPLVAYLRALPAGVAYPDAPAIGRVITAASARGQGHGRPLMQAGMAGVWSHWGAGPIRLSAQAHLAAYYGSLGFEVCGEGYLEDGIPHLPMRHPGPA